MLIAVASPNAFTVVALVFAKLNVVAVVVTSPPFTAKSPVKLTSPVTSPPVSLFKYLAST